MTCVEWVGSGSSEHESGLRSLGRTVARRVSWRSATHWVLLGAAVGYLAWRVPDLARDFAGAATHVGHPQWVWLGAAVVSGVAALVAYGELHRRLLLVGGQRLPGTTVQAISFAENAISTTVPVVGGAGSLGYAIDELRRRGVDTAVAAWSVLMAGVITTVTLLVVGSFGLAWAGWIPVPVAVLAAALVALGTTTLWLLLTHPEAPHRLLHGWTGADSAVRRLAEQVAALRPGPARWTGLIGVALASWLLDVLTLVASAAATGTRVQLGALVAGFLVVQASIALQVLPGGAGLAEAGLLGVLVGAGVPPAAAAATALTYRLISWLGLSVVGWAAYAGLHHTPHRRTAVPATAGTTGQRPTVVLPC